MIELVDRDAPAVVRLRQVYALRAALDAAESQALLDLASEADWDENAEFEIVGTRPVRIGADGSRLVDEHLPLEVAAAQQTSVDAAIWLIRDIVDLHARHPQICQALQTGLLPLWRARRFAQHASLLNLSAVESRAADEQIGPAIARVGWKRLWWLYRAAILRVAPDRMRVLAEQAAADRYVRTGPVDDDPATSYLSGRLDAGDAVAFSSLLDDLADALALAGEEGPKETLRARAIGVLADPQNAIDLLEQGPGADRLTESSDGAGAQPAPRSRRSRRPATRIHVHIAESDLRPGGVARLEGRGPVLVDQLRQLTGGGPVHLSPVVRVNGAEQVVDGYEIPAPLRAAVLARDRFEVFPYSSRGARQTDLDHTEPYRAGAKAQTRASNLGPLSRRAHRAKTHGGWDLWQPAPGVFWWRSSRDQVLRVGPNGTMNLTVNDPVAGTSTAEQLMLWQFDRRDGDQDGSGP